MDTTQNNNTHTDPKLVKSHQITFKRQFQLRGSPEFCTVLFILAELEMEKCYLVEASWKRVKGEGNGGIGNEKHGSML